MPVLGYKGFERYGQGWGEAHPKKIYNGGDAAGLVDHIRWSLWGTKQAYATGQTYTYKPHGGYYKHEVKARLRASDLGTCFGKPAYKKLYIREQRRPGGPMQKRWHPWGRRSGNVCRPAS